MIKLSQAMAFMYCCLLSTISLDSMAQVNPYRLAGKNALLYKNYYLLNLFEENNQVRQLLSTDKELLNLTQSKLISLKNTLQNCHDVTCYTAGMKFTADDINTVSLRLEKLYNPGNALDKMVKEQLIPSGTYYLYQKLEPLQLLLQAWQQDANGINHTIAVYGEGKAPNYPQIDSISFNVNDQNTIALIGDCAGKVLKKTYNTNLFFMPSLISALQLLKLNDRENAADYEPTEQTINKDAYRAIKSVDWKTYRYSLIMVPGAGPDDHQPINPKGITRCQIAAKLYFDGLAPFIMVSGGKVHPFKTKYCEALEMKKYLVDSLHIPVSAVIAEPHARHTTTNIRNCVRMIYRYGLPVSLPFITSTDAAQSAYISNMEKRCINELHYVPYKTGGRLSATAQAFYPIPDALQINADEPLDP